MTIIILALALAAAPAGFDTDGDGRADRAAPAFDLDADGTFDAPGGAPAALPADSIEFEQAWTSGSVLNNQWDADCGYLDGDSLLDILGHHWNPNQLHVFESDGAGGYRHAWTQSDSMPPGSYSAVTHGDVDDDGVDEIVAGEVSTLGKVLVFENSGDDAWASPTLLAATRFRARVVRVADTNGNDTNEIIVIAGSTDGGKVLIYEHTGPPGSPTWNLICDYSTVSYVFNGDVGDADNDGYPEVLIGCGGMHGFPMYIRRLCWDPAGRTYVHRMYESSVIGLHISPTAADLDNSGDNELIVGSSGDPYGQAHVFKYAGGDSFAPVWTSSMTASGNVIAVRTARLADDTCPALFCAPFAGVVYGFRWNGTSYEQTSYVNPGTGAAIRSIDHARDPMDELVLAESAPSDFISVWRHTPPQPVAELPGRQPPGHIRVRPNPSAGPVTIETPPGTRTVTVHDAAGRLVRTLDGNSWDGREENGRRATPGVYVVTACGPELVARARLVLAE